MNLPFEIMIPLYNETKALSFSDFYFNRLGVQPRYILDTQREEDTERILRLLRKDIVFFENDKFFIENGYQAFAEASPSDWILRIDCDEVPNRELIEFCRSFIEANGSSAVSFERHQVLWDDDRFLTATTERFMPQNSRQTRLFNRRRVSFNKSIHTPGILVGELLTAPSEATLFHLSWIFLTWEDRLNKADRYDAYGQPEYNRQNQLFDIAKAELRTLDAPFLAATYKAWLQSVSMG
jgi:hypothetical protein